MTQPDTPEAMIDALTETWFGTPVGPLRDRWFDKRPAFDTQLRDHFGPWVDPAANGELDDLATTARGTVALAVLLDQVPRNAWRDTPRSFAYDPAALRVARRAVAQGIDKSCLPVERLFLYLPFEHSEDLADQDTCIALIETLGNDQWLEYAHRHREIILRFGRFPHRNAVLGRPSKPEELDFLTRPGSSF